MEEESPQQVQCLFCAIDRGQIHSYKVYEDEQVVAALDIKPASIGHLVVFPKRHYTYLYEMETQEMSHFMNISRTLIPVLMKALGVKGVNLLYSAGPAAGQRTPHLCVHLIPRNENDGIALSWKSKQLTEQQLEEIQNKMISVISGSGTQKKEQPEEMKEDETRESEPVIPDATSKTKEDDPYYDIGDSPAKFW